jgi:hypothetical protein
VKRNRPHIPPITLLKEPMLTEPQWNDVTGLVRVAADKEVVELTSDSKITGDVTDALKRGVRVRLNGHQLWVDPNLKTPLRVSWEVLV